MLALLFVVLILALMSYTSSQIKIGELPLVVPKETIARMRLALPDTLTKHLPPILGISAPTENDSPFAPVGFCVERRFVANGKAITALAHAPDGRLFVALEADSIPNLDSDVFFDPYQQNRSIAVYDTLGMKEEYVLLSASSRITGLEYYDGALYISRTGEIGFLPDGGQYETLVSGFAVNGALSHANNGIIVLDGELYVAAGGVIDGASDGKIEITTEESGQNLASGKNPLGARILRVSVDSLKQRRGVDGFEVVATGVRNPYDMAVDPAGNVWFSENGATGIEDEYLAGDEINIIDKSALLDSGTTPPSFGFPLTLYGYLPKSYIPPAIPLRNSAAPTGVSWAYGTVFYAQYGRLPGLYRVGLNGTDELESERVMNAWPIIALETDASGTLWLGMGTGELLKVFPGCGPIN